MAGNYFDQFDEAEGSGPNYFDRFDDAAVALAAYRPPPKAPRPSNWRRKRIVVR